MTKLGDQKNRGVRLAVMDMWKPFRNVTVAHAPQAAILFDRFHIMRHLGEALYKVRKSKHARPSGKDRHYIKGQTYTLLARCENLTREGRLTPKILLAANKRLNNKIRVTQRQAYGPRDEECLRLKILTCMLPTLSPWGKKIVVTRAQ